MNDSRQSQQPLLPEALPTPEPPTSAGQPSPPDVVARQVQFALSQLPAENGAHRFEEICRNFARARLVPNLLPATGPVGAGGDAGRDFETYRSYLAERLGPHGGFAARLPEAAVAFACTLQQEDLPSKIRSDVAKICGGGVDVEAIYAFLVVPLPVGVRHRLQEEVQDGRGVHLEVFDLHALAEELSQPSLFWIAEQYLSLPASLTPAVADEQPDDDLPPWYVEDRTRWRERGAAQATLGQLLDLRDGLRHATSHLVAREDLPFWLSLMEPLCGAPGRVVRQRARYETAVAQMRGMGDLRPADGHVIDFFEEVLEEGDPARLSDAGALLTYASVAWSFARSDVTLEQLTGWGAALREHVEELLADQPPPVRRARLLEVLGQLCLSRRPGSLPRAPGPLELPEVSELVDEAGRPRRPLSVPADRARYFVDKERGLEAWAELATSLADITLFPVDALSHYLELLSPLLVDEPTWSSLVESVDEALARSEGDAAAGDRALDRALTLVNADRPLDALDELHKAKVRFFHGDLARSIASTLLAIGDLYGKLHLPHAARQHALAAASAAHASGSDEVAGLVPHALLVASEHDYRAGSSVSALQTLRVGLIGQAALVDVEVDPWADRDFSRALVTAGMSFNAAHDLLDSEFTDRVDDLLKGVDLLEKLREIHAEVGGWSSSDWASRADEQLQGRPFDDLGAERVIRFSALGLNWRISSKNEYRAVAAAERLAAAAQVLAADLAHEELLLLPTTIALEVHLHDGAQAEPSPRRHRDGKGRRWGVGLRGMPDSGALDPEAYNRELLRALVPVLIDVSLLSPGDLMAAIERAFARGITHKLCPVRPYDELIPYGPDSFQRLGPQEFEPPLQGARPDPRHHPALGWRDGPGPGFSDELAREMLETRYDQLPALMPVTLAALRTDRRFAAVVKILRGRGWRDWHILTAVYNIVLNVRLDRAGLNTAEAQSTEAGRQAAKDLAFTPESRTDPPAALAPMLNVERLNRAREGALGSLMIHWGMDLHAGEFEIEAAERLLAARYGYWDDDIEHDDPFAPDSS